LLCDAELIALNLKLPYSTRYNAATFKTAFATDRNVGGVFRSHDGETGLLAAVASLAEGRLFIVRRIFPQ